MSDALFSVREAEAIEAEAWTDLFAAAPASLGLRAEERHGATLLLAPAMPVSLFNRVLGLGVTQPVTEAQLDEVLALYRSAGVREFWIHVGAASRPEALEAWLTERGFRLPRRPTWAKVLRGREPAPVVATELLVRELRVDEATEFARVVGAAHQMPPPVLPWNAALVGRERWRAYGAFDGETLVAGGMLYVHGPRAWLGLGGTLAAHRGRGAQGALMARRIADALSLGCAYLETETGEPIDGEKNPSLSNMYRCGFQRVDARKNFALVG